MRMLFLSGKSEAENGATIKPGEYLPRFIRVSVLRDITCGYLSNPSERVKETYLPGEVQRTSRVEINRLDDGYLPCVMLQKNHFSPLTGATSRKYRQ